MTAAVVGGVLVVVLTVLAVRSRDQGTPIAAPHEPWQPPPVVASSGPATPVGASVSRRPVPSPSSASPSASRPVPSGGPDSRPPSPPPASSGAPSRPSSPPPPAPVNLSLRGDGEADGSTKALGRHFRDVRDDDAATYWSPLGLSGEVSIKWDEPVRTARVVVREAPGGGRIGDWTLRDHGSGTILAAGSGAGTVTFAPVTLTKITLAVRGDDGAPRVAELQVFAG